MSALESCPQHTWQELVDRIIPSGVCPEDCLASLGPRLSTMIADAYKVQYVIVVICMHVCMYVCVVCMYVCIVSLLYVCVYVCMFARLLVCCSIIVSTSNHLLM